MAGRKLGSEIAEHHDRHAHVLLDEGHDGLVEAAGLIELHRRDAQPFGIDLGRVRGVRARNASADVGVMADGAGEGEPLALVIKRFEYEDVGKVHAPVEGIVHDENVAGRHVVPEMAHDRFERRRRRAEVAWKRQPLRGETAIAVSEARRVVHVVLQNGGVRRPEDRQRHLVGN